MAKSRSPRGQRPPQGNLSGTLYQRVKEITITHLLSSEECMLYRLSGNTNQIFEIEPGGRKQGVLCYTRGSVERTITYPRSTQVDTFRAGDAIDNYDNKRENQGIVRHVLQEPSTWYCIQAVSAYKPRYAFYYNLVSRQDVTWRYPKRPMMLVLLEGSLSVDGRRVNAPSCLVLEEQQTVQVSTGGTSCALLDIQYNAPVSPYYDPTDPQRGLPERGR